MAAINGNRPRRINSDGKSITETRVVKADMLPGTFAVIDATTNEFVAATAAANSLSRIYIMNVDTLQGRKVEDTIPAGESGVGDYVEPGRQFAALAVKGSKFVKDTPVWLMEDKALVTSEQGTPDLNRRLIGYSQEVYNAPADKDALVLIRVR